jgi:hypothetical protein
VQSDRNLVLTKLEPTLRDALEHATATVRLCSPFISAYGSRWLRPATSGAGAAWELLTVLDPVSAAYGSLSITGLRELQRAGVELRHAPRVHAKIFVVDQRYVFIGSANLTASGLGVSAHSNKEMTVFLTSGQADLAIAILDDWWREATRVTASMLAECEQAAKAVPTRTSPPPDASAERRQQSRTADQILDEALGKQVWIKAVFRDRIQADQPWGRGNFVGSPNAGRPQFNVGDLLVIYNKGARVCNAVFRVTGPSVKDADAQIAAGIPTADALRWPWMTPIDVLLEVFVRRGVPLDHLGVTGQSLQPGHRRMPTGGLATALRFMTS